LQPVAPRGTDGGRVGVRDVPRHRQEVEEVR
jgi:hypothetical protein